jgi:small glutamine-rich tetratricopeptide repeat-containing protein alpha
LLPNCLFLVAIQCLTEAYNITGSALESPSLVNVDELFAACNGSASSFSATSESSKCEAERQKTLGNEAIAAKKPEEAVRYYSRAIELDPTNAVYYSNRAAAYSMISEHFKALDDAKESIALNPSYSKAHNRLGKAYLAIGEPEAAAKAFERALELEPNDATIKASLAQARGSCSAGLSPKASEASFDMDAAASAAFNSSSPNPLASSLPGAFDLASLMSNPQMRQMAAQMVESGAMEQMLKDPRTGEMMRGFMSNPDLMKNMRDAFGNGGGSGSSNGFPK